MTMPQVIGPIAIAAMALATVPVVHAQSVPAAEKKEAAKPSKPLVLVTRQIDGKPFKANGNWHRIEIELKAQSDGIREALMAQGVPKAYAGESVRWLNNVKVSLVVGYTPTGHDLGKPKVYQDVLKLKDAVTGGKSLEETKKAGLIENWRYYKASTTVLALEANSPKSVYFYIPGDIVKRDDISNPRPDVAYVTLEVDGQEIPVMSDKGDLPAGSFGVLFGSTLGKPDKVKLDKVREVADRATRDTAGVMRPQNLISSFVDPDWKSSPEFVREDAAK